MYNMANNRIKRYFGAIALGTVLTAVPSCTDTWDDHYGNDSSSGTTATLWDVIKDNPNFSRFANIARNAKYYKDNTHPSPGYTYEDILDGGQVNTLWIPDNNALTEEEYQKWMGMLNDSRADANDNAGYNVQQQFLGNHIALWRHNISEPGKDSVKMINGKNLIFNKTERTLAGIPLGEYNIPTANGVMHVLTGVAPFHYNFYEYLKFGEQPTKFGKYVVDRDTTRFMPDASIEGLPDENGNPTYVDSVYITSNRLFEGVSYVADGADDTWQMAEEGFGAPINNEDSVFVMILPTDKAWDDAYTELEKSHNYALIYENKKKGDINALETIKLTQEEADSLKKMSIEMDIISPLVFNIHKQPKKSEEIWKVEEFNKDMTYFDDPNNPKKVFLLNTFGDTLRAIDTWKPSSLFDGELKVMSNGYAYEVDKWNFPPQFYTPDVEVEIDGSGVFYNTQGSKFKLGPSSRRYVFSNDAYKEITSKYGRVSDNSFYHMDATGPTSGPKVEFKLLGNSKTSYVTPDAWGNPKAQVMSGHYDIQLVVVPHWYIDIARASKIPDAFYKHEMVPNPEDETEMISQSTGEIDEDYINTLASQNKYKIKATLTYCNGVAKDKNEVITPNKGISYNGLKVDTITLKENFEFKYSYKNMRFTYPTIYIESATTKSDKDGSVFDLVVDKIILKRRD